MESAESDHQGRAEGADHFDHQGRRRRRNILVHRGSHEALVVETIAAKIQEQRDMQFG